MEVIVTVAGIADGNVSATATTASARRSWQGLSVLLGCCCKRSKQLSLGRGREMLPLQQVFAEGVEVQRVSLGMQEHDVVQKGAKLCM
eukprot:7660104-Ditylum_brightwellii.AAC.1